MFAGFWRSCIEASDGEPGRDPKDARPFVADCIISNPPVMIHVHCAERLGLGFLSPVVSPRNTG